MIKAVLKMDTIKVILINIGALFVSIFQTENIKELLQITLLVVTIIYTTFKIYSEYKNRKK